MFKKKKNLPKTDLNVPVLSTADFQVETTPAFTMETPIEKGKSAIIMALMLLISLTFTNSFCSIYKMPEALTSMATVGMAGFPILFYLLYTFVKKGRIFADLGILALVGLYAGTRVPSVILGFKQLINSCVDALSTRTFALIPSFKISGVENQNDCRSVVLFVILFFVCWIVARSVYANPNPVLLIAATLIPLVPGLALGLVPTGFMFMTLVVCYCAAFSVWATERKKSKKGANFTASVGKKDNVIFTFSGKEVSTGATHILAAVTMGIAILAFLFGSLVLNESVYNNETIAGVRTSMYNVLRGETRKLLGINGGYLGVLENYEPGVKDALATVTTANMGTTVYIKNFTGVSYSGSRWRPLGDDEISQGERELGDLFANAGYHATNITADFLNTYRFSNHPIVQNSYICDAATLVRSGLDYTRTVAPYNTQFPKVGLDGNPLEYVFDCSPAMSATEWVQNYKLTYITTPGVMDVDLSQIKNPSAAEVNKQKCTEIAEIVYRGLDEERYTKFFKITKAEVNTLLTQDAIAAAGSAQGLCDLVANYLKNHQYAYKYESEPLMADMAPEDITAIILPKLEPYFETLFVTDSDLAQSEAEAQARADAYEKYAYDVYTQIPQNNNKIKELKETFKQVLTTKYRENFATLGDLVDHVRDYIWERVEYDTTNTKLPEGKDFVGYFMYDQGRGYSTLYASAATLIFRATGVPARYCEGFIIQPDDYQYAGKTQDPIYGKSLATGEVLALQGYYFSLTERYMHAWVELYIDGYGWVPVEMTPGFVQDTTVQPELMDNTIIGSTVIPGISGGNSDVIISAPDDQKVEMTLMYTLKNLTGGTVFGIIAAVILGVAVLAAAVIAARRFYRLQSISRSIHTDNYNANVCALYGYMMELLYASGYMAKKNHGYEKLIDRLQRRFGFISREMLEQTVHTMVKAKFSDEAITKQEYELVLDVVQRMKNQIGESLDVKKKLTVSYIDALL